MSYEFGEKMNQALENRLRANGLSSDRKAVMLAALFNPEYDLSDFREVTPVGSLDNLNPDSRPDLLILTENRFQVMENAGWEDNGYYVTFNSVRRWEGYANSGRLHYEAGRPTIQMAQGVLDGSVICTTNYDFYVLRQEEALNRKGEIVTVPKNVHLRKIRLEAEAEQDSGFAPLSLLQSILRNPFTNYARRS